MYMQISQRIVQLKLRIQKIWFGLLNNSFFRNVVNLSLGSTISQLLIIASSPIVSRLYSPSEYGLQGLVISFTGLIAVAGSLGLEVSIVSAENQESANATLVICFISNFVIALLGGLAMLFIISNNILSYGSLPLWSVFPSVIVIWAIGFFMALRYWAVRNGEYISISRALMLQGSGRAITPVVYGIFNNNWLGLLLGEIIGRVLGIQRIARAAYKEVIPILHGYTLRKYIKVIKSNWKFVLLGLPSSLINSLYTSLTIPFISTVFSTSLSGQFLFVQNMLAVPTSLISASVADVFHSKISSIKSNDPAGANDFLKKMMGQLTWLAILIYVPIAIFSPFLFPVIFGSNWQMAGIITSYISMLSMFAFVISPLSRIIFVYNTQEYKLLLDLFRLTIPFISIFGAKWFNFDFTYTLVSYTILGILGYLAYLFIIWKSVLRA